MTVLYWVEAICILFLMFGGAITYYGGYYYQAGERLKSLRLMDQIEQWRLAQPSQCGTGCGRPILVGRNICWWCRENMLACAEPSPNEITLNLCDRCSCQISPTHGSGGSFILVAGSGGTEFGGMG